MSLEAVFPVNDFSQSVAPTKRRCTVTVSARAWHGSKAAAQAVGCGSISELLEKLGNGELVVVAADEVGPPMNEGEVFSEDGQEGFFATEGLSSRTVTAWSLDSAGTQIESGPDAGSAAQSIKSRFSWGKIPKLTLTAACASLILMPILYVLDLRLSGSKKATFDLENALTVTTGDSVAGYEITDHMRIRPVHPVTGAVNVPHNGVDVATPSGTPVYAVGVTGDQVNVECWWDVDGGGWVADQTTESYPQLVFQSLHLLENECRSGKFTSGEVIALTGNSGLGSGEHYDFRVKVNGRYVDPPKPFLESALTGQTLEKDGKLSEF